MFSINSVFNFFMYVPMFVVAAMIASYMVFAFKRVSMGGNLFISSVYLIVCTTSAALLLDIMFNKEYYFADMFVICVLFVVLVFVRTFDTVLQKVTVEAGYNQLM